VKQGVAGKGSESLVYPFGIVLDEHVEQLLECPSLDRETAEELLEGYEYPGQILTELQASISRTGGYEEIDLPADPETIHREMSQAGHTYYTGKQEYLLNGRGTPPQIHKVIETDGQQTEYELLGVTEPGYTAHYIGTFSNRIELKQRVWDRHGQVKRIKNTESFCDFPAIQLENYVEDQSWQHLEQPDYSMLREQYQQENTEVTVELEGTSQADFDDFTS
jgi:hypothetical protein